MSKTNALLISNIYIFWIRSFLGVIIHKIFKFDHHIFPTCKQINSKKYLPSRSNYLFPLIFRSPLFKILIQTKFDKCLTLLIHLSAYIDKARLETCVKNSIKKIFAIKTRYLDHSYQTALLKPLNILRKKLRCFLKFFFLS